jgi:hypothetical protein
MTFTDLSAAGAEATGSSFFPNGHKSAACKVEKVKVNAIKKTETDKSFFIGGNNLNQFLQKNQ